MTRTPAGLLLAVGVLSMLRLWVASGQTLTALGQAGHDDRLYLNLAQHIAGGRWLGPFDNLTLARGPFYSMWIAATFIVGVPLQLSQNLLYIAACVVTILALRPVVRSSAVLVAIYAVMVLNPIMFGITRVLREGVYIPLTLLLAACLIGLFLRRTSSLRSLAIWGGGAGFALSGMWLARVESIWILPPVLFILAAAAFWLWRSRVDRLWRRGLLLVSPFAVLGATIALVSTINLFYYGVFVVTEVAGPDWLAAYGALSRVEHDSWQRYLAIPRHVRERIYRVSPAFAELRSAIEGELGRSWMSHGCKTMPETCGDITDGWFMFLLRDAVSSAGYYRSAPMAVGYYRRLADEVNAACDSGTLRCGPTRATMAPPWRREYGPLLLDSMARATTQVVRFQGISAFSSPSVGDELALLPFRLVTRDRLAPGADRLQVKGWGFSPNSDLLITVQDSGRTLFEVDLRAFASQDVFDYFVATEGQRFDRARDARFALSTPCVRDCSLVIRARGQDRVLGTLSLDGGVRWLVTPELRFHVASITKENDLVGFGTYGVDSVKLRILTDFIWLYGQVAPILTGILIITLVAAPIAVAFGYRSVLLVPMLTLVGAVIARIALIALIDATSFPSIKSQYLAPAHTLLLLAGLLACVEMGSMSSVGVRLAARWPRRAVRVSVSGEVSDRSTIRRPNMGGQDGPRHSAIATIVCYNNGANAARTLERVPPAAERDFDVVVVDDGSTDDTPAQLARFEFPVVRHERNQGVGAAIKSGLRYAIDEGYDLFCILAGNAKDDPRQIPKLLEPIRRGEADYVQGSRFAPGGSQENTPAFRIAMVKVHARFIQVLTGFPGTDALNGFRAYRTSLFKDDSKINVWQDWLNGYEFEMYVHYKVLSSGCPVTEVGVSKVYPAKKRGVRYSHIRPVLDWWRILRPIPLLMFRLKK